MKFKRLTVTLALVTLTSGALYLAIYTHSGHQPFPAPPQRSQAINGKTDTRASTPAPPMLDPLDPLDPEVADEAEPRAGGRRLEIYGRVLDTNRKPVEDVLINEERYFFSTRSDAEGRYRLSIELPRHRLPELQFLRGGFAPLHVRPGRDQPQHAPAYELDVILEDRLDSVSLAGWVGNEFGEGLEGARVELTALEAGSGKDYSLTVFTDDRGHYALEGVTPGERYRLSVHKAPDYPAHEVPELLAGTDPTQLNIVLPSLQFVDVNGMILNRDALPIPDFEIFISNVTTGIHSRRIVSDSSGFFTLGDFPLGEISLTTRGSEFFQINGLRLTADDYRNLTLTIDRGSYFLTGWISDHSGLPIERAMVTIDRSLEEGGIEYLDYRSQASDSEGRFAFENLGSGEYRVTVYAPGYRKHELIHRFSSQYEELRIDLESGRS